MTKPQYSWGVRRTGGTGTPNSGTREHRLADPPARSDGIRKATRGRDARGEVLPRAARADQEERR